MMFDMIIKYYNVFIGLCMILVYYILSLFHNKENKIDNRIYYTMLVPILMYIYYFYMYITSQLQHNKTDYASNSYSESVSPKTYVSSNESLMSDPYPTSSS